MPDIPSSLRPKEKPQEWPREAPFDPYGLVLPEGTLAPHKDIPGREEDEWIHKPTSSAPPPKKSLAQSYVEAKYG